MERQKWKDVNIKERTQYLTAIFALLSGITMCFLSFFLNEYEVADSVLMYCGEMIIFCAGVFGVNLYIKNKVLEAESRLNEKIDRMTTNYDRKMREIEEEQ